MKKSCLLSIVLCSLSTMIIYSSDKSGKYTEKTSELEYSLSCVKSGSYERYHHGTQTIAEEKSNAQLEAARNKNNKNYLTKKTSAIANSQSEQSAPTVIQAIPGEPKEALIARIIKSIKNKHKK